MAKTAKVKISRGCPMCGGTYDIFLSEVQRGKYFLYWNREIDFIQDALPELNPMEREFLKTGYCPPCQRLLFGNNLRSRIIRKERQMGGTA